MTAGHGCEQLALTDTQVVQYLLAKNFHLTALELLVEAQQAGHGDDVRDLEVRGMAMCGGTLGGSGP